MLMPFGSACLFKGAEINLPWLDLKNSIKLKNLIKKFKQFCI